ncbi:MAG: 16S rRNA (adenine(1518)-N(6)/adenine(1519)-N(6))-dimethyltransferase RsmA [Candidatus Thorarchaeota archaeon]
MNTKEIKLILKQLEIKPSKKLGQNFLIDRNVIKKIINVSEITQSDVILEIGTGLGALTADIAKLAKKIYGIEIDHRLYSFLKDKLSTYNNIEIIHGDVLDIEIPNHNKVISNIPYTITGPLIEKVFYNTSIPIGILTIEKSIANRIFLSGSYKDYSRISVGINAFMKPVLKSDIANKSFYPIPKIELSLIKIVPKDIINPFLSNNDSINFFLMFIAGIMPYKNKNIVNAVEFFLKSRNNNQYTKDKILKILLRYNLENKKVFQFSIDELIEISKIFYI